MKKIIGPLLRRVYDRIILGPIDGFIEGRGNSSYSPRKIRGMIHLYHTDEYQIRTTRTGIGHGEIVLLESHYGSGKKEHPCYSVSKTFPFTNRKERKLAIKQAYKAMPL
jgi:hypothetical protein